ncbi:MAG: helix-hairpin-helix domain-containing protein, partial [Selenomonadaceae bacterium]|nr:helix-hairpin-helix domain-containing protein [Selenomonadaceae bacterium]
IIDYRENNGAFKSIDEIKKVRGIGDKTFEKMRDQITV